jgi:hypothetical protein
MATKTIEQIDASLTRWKSRLRRAMTAIDKLEKQRKRLANKVAAVRVSVPAHPTVDSETTLGTVPPKPLPVPVLLEKLEQLAPAPDLAIAPPLATQPGKVKHGSRAEQGAITTQPVADDIPAFLRRQSSPSPVADQIRAEIEEKKKAKARGRIATMKAKKAGETKKMPLTGKAALAAIRSAE